MGSIIVLAIIVLVVLYKKGVFRKEEPCQCCGKKLKGTDQFVYGIEHSFVLCRECAAKIHPQIAAYAKDNWSYQDYTDYLAWEEETREERSQFQPTHEYGYGTPLMIDSDHGLFCLGTSKVFKSNEAGLVFRFEDLTDYDINFKPDEVKEGLLGTKVKGTEFILVELGRPRIRMEEALNYGVTYPLRAKGFFSSKYEYSFSDEFADIILTFSVCHYLAVASQMDQTVDETENFGELQKALALFMFDSMADVTEENLKKQRNALIKTFHPDAGEDNAAYAQKINDAYDLLQKAIRNK